MVIYNNSCLDITSEHTPDPFVTHANGKFYLTFTGNTRIPMWEASSLMDFYDRPNRGPVYLAPLLGPQSERLWAPELHCVRGRWYIYFAGADKLLGNRTHRMYVLGGPLEGDDPHFGSWELLGHIKGMDQRQWAIDGTVFEIDGTLYFCYSGWPRTTQGDNPWEDQNESLQQLFIIRLHDPVTAASEPVMIGHPSNSWERLGEYGAAINEGPQWLESPTGHWRGLAYSCSASWTKDYKMATLQYLGGDPLSPASWSKSSKPLLQNRPDGLGPYGPGHGCFLRAGGETVALFHATDRDTDGNQNRRCRMQRVRWTPWGPDMGGYVGAQTSDVERFLQSGKDGPDTAGLSGLVHALTGREASEGHDEL
ncbi:hypothetical protein LTR85_005152 [Meristemomyces frigidus]|nr:hypothetical protein LTR85_005152 [Meristemomyces frigidus]